MGVRTSIIENNFLKNNSPTYKLSFLLGEDSFFYCVHSNTGELLLLKEFQQDVSKNGVSLATDLANCIVADKNLALSYGQVKVAFSGMKSCFIPSRLFHPSKSEVYLSQLTTLETMEAIESEELVPLQSHHVFSVEKTLWNTIKRSFPNAVCSHVISSLSLAFQKIAIEQGEKQFFLNTRDQKLQIFVFEQRQLLFSNTFRFTSSKDFLYYVLLIYEQFNLSIEDHPLWLSGAILESSEIYNILYRYVQEIRFTQLPKSISLGQEFKNNIVPHLYFDVLSI